MVHSLNIVINLPRIHKKLTCKEIHIGSVVTEIIQYTQTQILLLYYIYLFHILSIYLYLMTSTIVSTNGIPTDVLTAPVIGCTLVFIRKENGGKSVLLDRVVRGELEA